MLRKLTAHARIESVSIRGLNNQGEVADHSKERYGEVIDIKASGHTSTGSSDYEDDKYFPISISVTKWPGHQFCPNVGEEIKIQLSYLDTE